MRKVTVSSTSRQGNCLANFFVGFESLSLVSGAGFKIQVSFKVVVGFWPQQHEGCGRGRGVPWPGCLLGHCEQLHAPSPVRC